MSNTQTMASIQVQPGWHVADIVSAAGADPTEARYDPQSGTVTAPVAQAALDAALAAYNHADVSLAAFSAMATTEVKRLAGALRALSVTATAGKDMAYIEKRTESARWQAIEDAGGTPDPDDFPWAKDRAAMLSTESNTTVETRDVIGEWAARADAWAQRGRQIEKFEETYVFRINEAATAAQVNTHLADARLAADQLKGVANG